MTSSLPSDLLTKVESSRVLVVGAGGIGCELLKNLVLTGFKHIHVVDLDTIELSNLNRQFLFQKQHVTKPKAEVACNAVKLYKPDIDIQHVHGSIISSDFDVDFFKSFDLVMNALDNKAARSHVNRMCLASDVPLIESGTSGYLGQMTVIKKGLFECYDCVMKAPQKTFPGCTIRNTPSEPIHCIVWAKHLFNQLFGEADTDEDVSPDMHDPELEGKDKETEKGEGNKKDIDNANANGATISTRKWAQDSHYDSKTLFNKFFHDDIKYLLSMENLWKKRRSPTVLEWDKLEEEIAGSSTYKEAQLQEQRVWAPRICREVFADSVGKLIATLKEKTEGSVLVWDKDDHIAVDFVVACSNLRAHIFGIEMQSKFNVKSMAGNIIPAIATTNAIIAGVIVTEALRIMSGDIQNCKCAFLLRNPNPRNKVLVDIMPEKPNKKCYVCSPKPQVNVKLDINTFIIKNIKDKVLKQTLSLMAPDVEVADGSGRIIISSEEGETTVLEEKTLAQLGLKHGVILSCDDFLQRLNLHLVVHHSDSLDEEKDFEIISGEDIVQGLKRAAEEEIEDETAAKKRKIVQKEQTNEPMLIE